MEKRMLSGVRKKRPVKRSKKKKLLNRVFNYFTSDSHMFAPLVSRPTSAFTSSIKKSIRGGEIKTPVRENKLLNNVCDYLKSNCYMYAPLLAPPRALISSLRGSSLYVERVTATIEVSKKKVILKGYKPKEKSADGRLENQASRDPFLKKSLSSDPRCKKTQ